jgi:hypothetical protein
MVTDASWNQPRVLVFTRTRSSPTNGNSLNKWGTLKWDLRSRFAKRWAARSTRLERREWLKLFLLGWPPRGNWGVEKSTRKVLREYQTRLDYRHGFHLLFKWNMVSLSTQNYTKLRKTQVEYCPDCTHSHNSIQSDKPSFEEFECWCVIHNRNVSLLKNFWLA